MTRRELEARLRALGYITQEQMAEALCGDTERQATISKYLSGARPVPAWVDRSVELLEVVTPVILSKSMVTALEQADGPGAAVPTPTSDEVQVRRVDWPEVYEALEAMGAVEYFGGVPMITKRGWNALQKKART